MCGHATYLLWQSFMRGLNAVFTEVLALYLWCLKTLGSCWECQAEMISLEAPTASGIQLGEWSKLTGAKRGSELMPFIPKVKGFFCFLGGILAVSLLASVWFEYKLNCLGALEPDWSLSWVCLLSCQFQRTYQKPEIWTLKKPLTALYPLQPLPFQALHVQPTWLAKWGPRRQHRIPVIFFRIPVIESSHPVKILKSSWD